MRVADFAGGCAMNGTRLNVRRVGVVLGGAVVVVSAVWGIVGCGPARRDEALAGEKPAMSWEAARGEVAFIRYCHQCHPGGSGGLGPAINDKPLPGGLIKTQVRIGGGAMPAFSKERLSEEELDGIVAYLGWKKGVHTGEH
jgi:mono/diheme cytochrome c family protein